MAYNNDNLAVAIHDTDNIITEENIEEIRLLDTEGKRLFGCQGA